MEQLASLFLHSRTQAHVFHLGVKGAGAFAAHTALQTYYTELLEILDPLIESYQGAYGLIEFQEVHGLETNCSIDAIVEYFDKLCEALEKLKEDKKLSASWIQNQIDNIAQLLYTTKYKLVNLQ